MATPALKEAENANPPIKWCPPASAANALTHNDWARLGWTAYSVSVHRGPRRWSSGD